MRHTGRMRSPRTALTAISLALLVATAGCGSDDKQTLTVLAAASLTDVFEDLAAEFEASHDGTTIEFSFGSSTALAEQVADGAPGDVLATADAASMQLVEDAGVTEEVTVFATNVLTIVTPAGNPAGIETLDDLDDTTWVRCTDEAPCGRIATAVLDTNDITAEPASLEEDVRATLDKVVAGEADAGLVYATDAVAAGDAVTAVPIPGAESVPTSYVTAALAQSADAELAQDWIDFLVSPEGRAVLERAGFGAP